MIKVIELDKSKFLKSELAKELYNKLINIDNDDYWAMGIIYELYDDNEKYQNMIDIINQGETDPDNIFELAFEMANP